MSANPLSRTYRALAEDVDLVLPEPWFRRAWAAARHGDEELTLALVTRPEAPADLRAQFAALTSARARAAFLSRTDVTTAEALAVLAQEKRVTVLAAVAGAEATPAAVFPALVAQMRERGSSVLATALVDSPATPSAQRLAALEFLVARGDTVGHTQHARLTRAVDRLEPAEAAVAAATLPPDLLPGLLARDGLATAVRLLLLERLVGPTFAGAGPRGWGACNAPGLVAVLLQREDLQLEVMAALDALLAAPVAGMGEDHVREVRRELGQRAGGRLAGPGSAAQADRVAELARAADPATDPALLAVLAAAADGRDVALADRLAENPATPAAAAADLVGLLDTWTAVLAAYRAQAGWPGRDAVRRALVLAHPRLLTDPDLPVRAFLADFDDPGAAAAALVPALSAELSSYRGSWGVAPLALTALLLLAEDPLAAAADPVLALPWPYLFEQRLRGHTRWKGRALTQTVLDVALEHLGADGERWAVFERLAPDFPGTFGQLLLACAAVAA